MLIQLLSRLKNVLNVQATKFEYWQQIIRPTNVKFLETSVIQLHTECHLFNRRNDHQKSSCPFHCQVIKKRHLYNSRYNYLQYLISLEFAQTYEQIFSLRFCRICWNVSVNILTVLFSIYSNMVICSNIVMIWPQYSIQINKWSDLGSVAQNFIRRHLIPWLIFWAVQNTSLRSGFINASLIRQGIRVLYISRINLNVSEDILANRDIFLEYASTYLWIFALTHQ